MFTLAQKSPNDKIIYMMSARDRKHLIPLDILRDRIAEAVATHVKAYNVPKFCEDIGLGPGDSDEAHRSKRIYVKNRLMASNQQELLQRVLGSKGS